MEREGEGDVGWGGGGQREREKGDTSAANCPRQLAIVQASATYTYMHAILERHTYPINASLSHNSERANWDGSLGEGERERERERGREARDTHRDGAVLVPAP